MQLFVYGPYMNPKYLKGKGINIINSQKAVLKDYSICFSTKTNDWKYAMIDIKESMGSKVEGVLYDIDDNAMNTFDNHENIKSGTHNKIKVKVETEKKEAIEAYTFTSPHKEGDLIPSNEYLKVIVDGAVLNSLSTEYINFIKSFSNIK